MEIKNKNIFLNLNEGEEIVYVAEKDKVNFYWNFILITFVALPVMTFFDLISIFDFNLFGSIWMQVFMLIILPFCYYATYKIISDYFFTEVILTNQRFIISRYNKIRSVSNEQVNRIIGSYGYRGAPISTTIKLKDKKSYRFLFIDKNIIRNKFKEIAPNYDDSKAVEKDKKQGYIILAILLLLLPFFMYAEYKLKLSDNQNKPYKSAKRQHNSKEPYFDTYMTNLQDKIKSNWNPPKGRESSNVVLLFKVDRSGNVLKTKIMKSSNNTAIDTSAIEALKKSEPFEPLPKEFKGKDVDVQFNFDYNTTKNRPKI